MGSSIIQSLIILTLWFCFTSAAPISFYDEIAASRNLFQWFSGSSELDALGFSNDPEIKKNASEIIEMHGFHVQEHFVTTEDGYILCLIRMRKPDIIINGSEPKVVFLQHGLLDSAHTWINNLRNESLGFILADAGFDVWLGNSRGSTYSRRHKYKSPDHLPFWEFSWDQMAKYDLPASLYYVLSKTGVQKLGYVGHSQGSQIAFAQFDRDPVLQSRISILVTLAPVAFLTHLKSPIRIIAPFAQRIENVLDRFGHGEFLSSSKIIRLLSHFLCRSGHLNSICTNMIYLLAGYSPENTNQTRVPVYIAHTPAGTSIQNIVHYCQAMRSDHFRQFDYGKEKNLKIYGQEEPPEYGFTNIALPVAIYHGGKDLLAVEKDVGRIRENVKDVIVEHQFFSHYNHLDFVWGIDAGYILYPSVKNLLKKYSNV